MRQRSQPLNGSLIRLLRERLCLTVADAAAAAGYSTRAWQKLEAGNPAFRSTLQAVASVLQVAPDVLITDGSFGLSADLEAFGSTGLGTAVLTLNRSYLRRSAAEVLYGLAVSFDALGDFDSASTMCAALQSVTHDDSQKAAAAIRLAAIDGHRGKAAEGLKRLEVLRQRLRARRPLDKPLYYWACYQTGVLLVTSRRDREAATMLRRVERHAPLADQKTSARHQLGVLALRAGRYRQAEQLFRSCLLKRPAGSFRRAFEYRRIGEACALDGRNAEAVAALEKALDIARRARFVRYEREISRVAAAFGLALDA